MSSIAGINGDAWATVSPSVVLEPIKDAVSNASTASGTSLTWSHTVGTQTNMILIVAVAVGGSATCSGVTYAGAAMTQLSSKAQGTETVYLFYKLAPATGANNIVASFSAAVAGIGLGVSYYDVSQSTPFGTAATNSGTSGNSSNTVTTTSASQLVLDINFANGTSSTAGASQNVETSNVAVSPFYFADIAATGSNMSLSWTNAGTVTIWIELSVAMNTAESFSDSGDHIHYFSSVGHQFWDPTKPIIVQNSPNGTSGWVTVTDYVFYYPVGEIVFNTARGVGTNNFTQVIQGNYFSATQIDGANKWRLAGKGMTKDVTPFQASGSWAVNLGIIKSASGSIDAYRQDGRFLTELNNTSGTLIACQLWFNEVGGFRWQFFAQVTGVQQNIDAQDVDKQTINFQVSGPLYLITSNTLSATTVTQE